MSQFKRFNSSDNTNWNTNDSYPAGTLTWDPDNGLRLHDGNTSGGNSVGGGGSSNFYDLTNRPTGNTAVHDLQGGSSSLLNGNFLKQISTGVSEWVALPTTYDTLTINTKVEGGLVGAAGTQITGIEGTLGSGQPWQFAFINTNSAFSTFYDQGSSIIGWKMYPASNPSAFVTVTEYLNGNQLGAPGLGFDGSLGQGPWVAESPDYTAGTPGPLTLSSGTHNVTIGTNGNLTLPAGMNISYGITWPGNAQIYEDTNLVLGSNNSIGLISGNDITFETDGGGTLWKFDSNGHFTFPDGSVQNTAYTGTLPAPADGDSTNGNADLVFYDGAWKYTSRVTFNPATTTLNLNGNSGTGGIVFPDGTTQTTAYTGGGSSFSGSYDDLTDKPTIPTDVNQLADSSSLLPAAQVRYEMRSANFTAVAGKTYWLDSGTSAKTVTLPASPTAGDWVKIYDGSLNWTTYNLTVNGNGNNIRTVDMGAGQVWGTPASTATLNQSAISPTGPLGATFVWDGTYWHGAA